MIVQKNQKLKNLVTLPHQIITTYVCIDVSATFERLPIHIYLRVVSHRQNKLLNVHLRIGLRLFICITYAQEWLKITCIKGYRIYNWSTIITWKKNYWRWNLMWSLLARVRMALDLLMPFNPRKTSYIVTRLSCLAEPPAYSWSDKCDTYKLLERDRSCMQAKGWREAQVMLLDTSHNILLARIQIGAMEWQITDCISCLFYTVLQHSFSKQDKVVSLKL